MKSQNPSLLNKRPDVYEKSVSKLQKIKSRHKGIKRLKRISQNEPLKLAITSDVTGERSVSLPPSQKLFIGNIAEGTTNKQLKSLFERFANVIEADVIKDYGFVHIEANAGKNLNNYLSFMSVHLSKDKQSIDS